MEIPNIFLWLEDKKYFLSWKYPFIVNTLKKSLTFSKLIH